MRPYFAIVKDSFREAWRSWALWTVLALITIVLLLLAPIGASKKAVLGLQPLELREREGLLFLAMLVDSSEADGASPAKAVFEKLDPETRKEAARVVDKIAEELSDGKAQPGPLRQEIARASESLRGDLDAAMRKPDFYEADAWPGVNLRPEAFELKSQGLENLEPDRVARFNRVAMESAFPEFLYRTPDRGYVFSYLVWDANPDNALAITEEAFEDEVSGWLRFLMSWVFGSFGILIAIIVTAPIVPQTFDPGALSLLLSKPVTRLGVFLAKYVGGCAFVTICITYLVAGMTLLLGLRMGIWDWTFLYYIPTFVFVFAIYHSLSVTAGVVFRSTIVSISLVLLLWAACLTLWTAKSLLLEPFAVVPVSAAELIRSGEQTFAVTRTGGIYRRNEATDAWEEIFRSNEEPPFVQWRLGPTYDPSREALFAQRSFGFQFVDQMLSYATRDGAWRRKAGPTVGLPAQKLFFRPEVEVGEGDDAKTVPSELVFVGANGPMTLREDPLAEEPSAAASLVARFAGGGPFRPLVGRALRLDLPIEVAMHEASGDLAIYAQGELIWLALQSDGDYEVALRERFAEDDEEEERVLIDVGGPQDAPLLAIARADGSILPIRVERGEETKLEKMEPFAPEGDSVPKAVRVRPDGSQIAALFHVGTLWIHDLERGESEKPWIEGQGNLTAAAWFGNDDLAVADGRTGIRVLDADGYSLRERIDMPSDFWVGLYRWVVLPFYTIFPKPGEIDRTMTWLQTGEETRPTDLFARFVPSLDTPRTKLNPMAPIWSGLLFIGVMLTLGGWYFTRQEY